MAIMALLSAYTEQTLTWEQVHESELDLTPESYAWNAAPPAIEVAVPGQTPFV